MTIRSGILTYSQSGAQFGLSQLWLAIFMLPLMISVQEISARIALVTDQGLASVIRQNYSRKVLYAIVGLLLVANTINLGADVGAMADLGTSDSEAADVRIRFWFWWRLHSFWKS